MRTAGRVWPVSRCHTKGCKPNGARRPAAPNGTTGLGPVLALREAHTTGWCRPAVGQAGPREHKRAATLGAGWSQSPQTGMEDWSIGPMEWWSIGAAEYWCPGPERAGGQKRHTGQSRKSGTKHGLSGYALKMSQSELTALGGWMTVPNGRLVLVPRPPTRIGSGLGTRARCQNVSARLMALSDGPRILGR